MVRKLKVCEGDSEMQDPRETRLKYEDCQKTLYEGAIEFSGDVYMFV